MIAIATRGLIDGATGHDSRQMLLHAILMGGGVAAIRVCGLCAGLLEARTGAELLRNLREMVLRETMNKRYVDLDGFHSGELVNRMLSDAGIVSSGIMGVAPGIAGMTVSFVGTAVILLGMDWRFILLMVAGGLLGLALILVFQLSWLLCMLWGCYGIYRGDLTYGMLAAIIQLVGQIQSPITGAAGVAGQIFGTVSSAERLKEILDLPDEERSAAVDIGVMYQELKEIKLCQVDFSYGRGAELVLEKVNFRIRPGETVGITGISGSGKSTLFQLLLGIYPPSGGHVSFCFADGKEKDASPGTRGLFAYVPQGNTLFSGTLRENLLLFTDSATEEEIMLAAKAACMESFLTELPDGLDTVLGERGDRIIGRPGAAGDGGKSGGGRQRGNFRKKQSKNKRGYDMIKV